MIAFLLAASVRFRRMARPRTIVLITVYSLDGTEAVVMDVPNWIPRAENWR